MRTAWSVVTGLAAVLSMTAALADQPRTDPQAPVADKPDATLTPRDMTEREQEYFSALKKCEPLAEQQRQECAKALKSKYGVM
jgi:hypothetical protein